MFILLDYEMERVIIPLAEKKTFVQRCIILLESKSKQTLILGSLYCKIVFIRTHLSKTIHRTKIRKSLLLL